VPKDDPSYVKTPSQKELSGIGHHSAWLNLYDELTTADARRAANATIRNRESSRLISASADHSGDWLNNMPTMSFQRSDRVLVGLQRRAGLYLSAAAAYFDAREAAGLEVTEEERLGDGFAHNANSTSSHKWVAVAWRQATANATLDTVYLGDKKKGKQTYAQFNATYVPDVIRLNSDDGCKPELLEVKNYSPFIKTTSSPPSVVSFTGHQRPFGNTEEALKWRVLGSRQRGMPAAGRSTIRPALALCPHTMATTTMPSTTARLW